MEEQIKTLSEQLNTLLENQLKEKNKTEELLESLMKKISTIEQNMI